MNPEDLEDTKVLLPLIRRIMPSMIASEIAGVQPMSAPASNIAGYNDVEQTSKGWIIYSTSRDQYIRYDQSIEKVSFTNHATSASFFYMGYDVEFFDSSGHPLDDVFVVAATKISIIETPYTDDGTEPNPGTIFSFRYTRTKSIEPDFSHQWTWNQFIEEDFDHYIED